MSKLLELAKESSNITVVVTLSDLIECNEALIAKTKQAFEQAITDGQCETYSTIKMVCKQLDVDRSTLWRWAKLGYLVPIELGRHRRYRMSEVKALLDGKLTKQG